MARNRKPPRQYVPHHRYGDQPRYTDLRPDSKGGAVNYHWNTQFSFNDSREHWLEWGYEPEEIDAIGSAIPGTAVAADLDRQTPATIPVTHYLDIERKCAECRRWFIFFAEEQKYWYEELEFPLESDCLHCSECRKVRQELQQQRFRYEELIKQDLRSRDEDFELARARLDLVAAGVFAFRQLDGVRNVLNRYPDDSESPDLREALNQVVAAGEPKKRRVKGKRSDLR